MEKLDVITKKVDVLPMVKYYMDQLGIYDLFAKYVQNPMRSPVDSAQILSIMVANIVCASQPLYKIENWAAGYMDGLSEYSFNASIHAYPVSAESLDPAGRSGEYAAGIKRVAQSEQGVATNLATLLAFETL